MFLRTRPALEYRFLNTCSRPKMVKTISSKRLSRLTVYLRSNNYTNFFNLLYIIFTNIIVSQLLCLFQLCYPPLSLHYYYYQHNFAYIHWPSSDLFTGKLKCIEAHTFSLAKYMGKLNCVLSLHTLFMRTIID